MRLLLAEDDRPLRLVLVRGLQQHGYVVDAVERGDDALHLLTHEEYAAAVLDWRMPGLEGPDIVRGARERGRRTPILMLTARDTARDRVQGLDAGADDYLVKPFDFDELLARIRALLRRPADVTPPLLRCGPLELDPATHEVRRDGAEVRLTPREFALLEVLMRRAPSVVTRETLTSQVWDEAEATSWNALEAHIARLRAKLGGGVRIVAVRGTGYRMTQA